jgi:endonuclease/exonuclease/phosphatase (EEP) superfamily protein YafD
VISFNVLTSNGEKTAVVDWLTRNLSTKGTNVVFLTEVDRAWEEALRPLEKSLPFSYRSIREDNFGIAVYSSAEIKGVAFDSFPDCEVPVFAGSLTFKDKEVRLIGAHPVPPSSSDYFELRNECLRDLKESILAQPQLLVLMGDLNTSPWGPNFPKYMNDPFPWLFRRHTWETMGGIVSTSIDHVLYLGDFQVTGAMIGPDLGSDHRPVVVKLGF